MFRSFFFPTFDPLSDEQNCDDDREEDEEVEVEEFELEEEGEDVVDDDDDRKDDGRFEEGFPKPQRPHFLSLIKTILFNN